MSNRKLTTDFANFKSLMAVFVSLVEVTTSVEVNTYKVTPKHGRRLVEDDVRAIM